MPITRVWRFGDDMKEKGNTRTASSLRNITVLASRFQDTQTAGFILQEVALILLCVVFGFLRLRYSIWVAFFVREHFQRFGVSLSQQDSVRACVFWNYGHVALRPLQSGSDKGIEVMLHAEAMNSYEAYYSTPHPSTMPMDC